MSAVLSADGAEVDWEFATAEQVAAAFAPGTRMLVTNDAVDYGGSPSHLRGQEVVIRGVDPYESPALRVEEGHYVLPQYLVPSDSPA